MIDDISERATADAEEKSYKGAVTKLEDVERQDAVLSEVATKLGKTNLGVLMRAMSAYGDEEYRNILKNGSYGPSKSRQAREKARQAVKAIDECRRFGNDDGIKSILDDITAQSAVEPSGLLEAILEALTHTTFTSNSTAAKKGWRDNDRSTGSLS